MVRIVVRSVASLILVAILAFPLDWLIWRLRVASGGGMDRITVSQVTIAALKGNKDDFYVDPVTEVECSRSIFPQAGGGACWWLRRHPQIVREE